jgi:alanine transaminase
MYLFPQIDMPEKAIAHAKELGKPADVMYALEMLGEYSSRLGRRFGLIVGVDATGICAVAGSGFGQEEGTYHVRVTALCPGRSACVEEYVGKIEKFHKEFMEKYA